MAFLDETGLSTLWTKIKENISAMTDDLDSVVGALTTDEATLAETSTALQTDEATLAETSTALQTDEATLSETNEKLATDEATLAEKVTELSTAIDDVQAAVEGLDTESIQTAVNGMTEAAESVSTSAETFSKWAAIASDIYDGKAALVEALARQGFTCSVEDSLTTIGEYVKLLAKIFVYTDYLGVSGVAVYQTTSADETVRLTYYAEYFQSIIVDGEELQDGTVTGALTYTFAEAGNHEVTLTLVDNPTTLQYVFYQCTALVSVADALFSGCGNVTSLYYAFSGCTALIAPPDLTACTALTNGYCMFYGCSSMATPPDLTACTALTNGYRMFCGCSSMATPPDLTACTALTNGQGMFYGCSSMATPPDLTACTALTNGSYMFNGCSSMATPPDLTACTLLTTVNQMLRGCTSLTEIPDGFLANQAALTDAGYLCYGCTGLTKIGGSLFNADAELTTSSYMFYGCTATDFEVDDLDVTTVRYMDYMFSGCTGIRKLSLVGFGTFGGLTVTNVFYNCTAWGGTDWILTEEEHLQSLEDTLLNNSYDRATNGYSSLTVTLPSAVYARLTDEQIESITNKGYTLTY